MSETSIVGMDDIDPRLVEYAFRRSPMGLIQIMDGRVHVSPNYYAAFDAAGEPGIYDIRKARAGTGGT